MGRLDGRVAIVTGAAQGIGAAYAKRFAEEGAKVAICDLLDCTNVVNTITQSGGEAFGMEVDVSDEAQVAALVARTVETFGRVDVMVPNAAIFAVLNRRSFLDIGVEEWDRVMAVNVRGVWLGIKYAVPVMRERGGGSIVITSSTAGIGGTPDMSAYTTSKHAVIGLMRTASLEGAPYGIRVNTVNPAPIETRMMRSIEEMRVAALDDSAVTVEVAKQAFADRIPLSRYGDPTEVARMMLFLASDDSSFCTGGVYMVDGGRSAGSR